VSYVTHVDDAAIYSLCASPNGPVQKDLKSRARRVETGAKRQVGVETGRLRESIKADVRPGRNRLPEIYIGSNVRHALMHHEGTRPHIIHPSMRRTLRFKVRGRVVYTTVVRHPGTRPNHYLTDPLWRYGRG
jgi:hypothetical protein